MSNTVQLAVRNLSSVISDKDVQDYCEAQQIQFDRDYGPLWKFQAHCFFWPKDILLPNDTWLLGFFDDADQPGALGYHDFTASGHPIGKAFVKTSLRDHSDPFQTAFHEALEMAGDPDIIRTVTVLMDNGIVRSYAYEMCDPCESGSDGYVIHIDSGRKFLASDFVLPAWFNPQWTGRGKRMDFTKKLIDPLTMNAGGYMSYIDAASDGWQQVMAVRGCNLRDHAEVAACTVPDPRPGRRHLRRCAPPHARMRSTAV